MLAIRLGLDNNNKNNKNFNKLYLIDILNKNS